jgi:hypothetical protein
MVACCSSRFRAPDTTRRQPGCGVRVDVGCRVMTIWALWARFRSTLGDGEVTPGSVVPTKAPFAAPARDPDCRREDPGAYVFKRVAGYAFHLGLPSVWKVCRVARIEMSR